MLFPRKVKHRKWQTLRKNEKKIGYETRGLNLDFGSHGLKVMEAARVTSNQIEAARKTVARVIKKTGKLWIRIFPDMPTTTKPAEVKMGKGKGAFKAYVAPVRPGRLVFEIDGLPDDVARDVLRKAGSKLPMKTKVVSREV